MEKVDRLVYVNQHNLYNEVLNVVGTGLKRELALIGINGFDDRIDELIAQFRENYINTTELQGAGNEKLTIDDLYEMEALPVWVIPKDADMATNRHIGYYLISVADETLINGVGHSYDFMDVEKGNIAVYQEDPDRKYYVK